MTTCTLEVEEQRVDHIEEDLYKEAGQQWAKLSRAGETLGERSSPGGAWQGALEVLRQISETHRKRVDRPRDCHDPLPVSDTFGDGGHLAHHEMSNNEIYGSGSRLVLGKAIISGTRSPSLVGLVIISGTEDLNNQYLHFKAECENGLLENKASFKGEGTLQAQVKSLRDTIQLDKRRTDLKEELNEVRTEIEQEKSGRREIEPLVPSTQDVTRNMMDEGVVDDLDFGTMVQMEAEEPEYQLKYAGPRYEGNPVLAAEYKKPVNELEYAGPIYEPDSFGVPMEYPPNLDAGPVDFPSDVLVNDIKSAAGLDDFNMEDVFPNFDPQVLDFGSTYDLPPLPAPPASSPPTPVITEGMQSTRKHKTRVPEVDV
ncbi:hypothetical protein K438DRAFT_1771025 [Mycena galopus ATCC 62051]|nr:hypothetical protein K438DRAFT_1771025 [Mycena galopus ATCC 62051]